MSTFQITKRQAVALLLQVLDMQDAAEVVLAPYLTRSFLTRNGCQVKAHKKGAVITYTISGYAQDGSDVTKDVTFTASSVVTRSTVWGHVTYALWINMVPECIPYPWFAFGSNPAKCA